MTRGERRRTLRFMKPLASPSRRLLVAVWICALASAPGLGNAKGCLKGAVVGGVAGHVAGGHDAAGAAAGCAIGHHHAKKQPEKSAQAASAASE